MSLLHFVSETLIILEQLRSVVSVCVMIFLGMKLSGDLVWKA